MSKSAQDITAKSALEITPKSALEITLKHTNFAELEAKYKAEGEAFLNVITKDAGQMLSAYLKAYLKAEQTDNIQNLEKATEWLVFAAQRKHGLALKKLLAIADLYYKNRKLCPENMLEAAKLFKLAAALDSQLALKRLHDIAIELSNSDKRLSFECFRTAALLGDSNALENLTKFGEKLTKSDPILAFQCLCSANQLGHLEAKRNLGIFYIEGIGVSQNLDRAIELLKECITTMDKITLGNIDKMENRNEAIELFKEWFMTGNKDKEGVQLVLENIHILAIRLLTGRDKIIPQNIKRAVELSIFGAEQGYIKAFTTLLTTANCYYHGNSPCPKNPLEAIKIWIITAKLGNKPSFDHLNKIADELKESDPKLSFECLNSTAALGDITAKRKLATYYFHGIGVNPDTNRAIILFKECYAAGDRAALDFINAAGVKLLSGYAAGAKTLSDDATRQQDFNQAFHLITFAAQNGVAEHRKDDIRLSTIQGVLNSNLTPDILAVVFEYDAVQPSPSVLRGNDGFEPKNLPEKRKIT